MRAGGDKKRIELSAISPATGKKSIDLLALDEALDQLDAHDHRACKIVKLRFFSGLTVPQTAEVLNVSVSTVENDWVYAKSWLKRQLRSEEDVI